MSYDHVDAKLDIMASSMSKMRLSDSIADQKDEIINRLEDEVFELKRELESLRLGFRDGISFIDIDSQRTKNTPSRNKEI
jgi:hypothetical protein